MTLPSTITIDGTAASGKSTVGRELARQLNYLYFDTGAMYRAVTLVALEQGVDISDSLAVAEVANTVELDVLPPTADDGRQYTVLANGRDVTWEIRSARVDASVSQVAANPKVRETLVPQQVRVGRRGKVVMVGRDIGTVVLPEAELKLYFNAMVEVRARRRWEEVKSRGGSDEYEAILKAMRRRDETDSQREIAPMRPADDAIMIDTSDLTVEEVQMQVQAILEEAKSGEKS